MKERILSDELTQCILEYISNTLQAHDADLAEELKTNTKQKASIGFVLVLQAVGSEVFPKIKVRIPRESVAVETMLPKQRQLF